MELDSIITYRLHLFELNFSQNELSIESICFSLTWYCMKMKNENEKSLVERESINYYTECSITDDTN